MPGAGGDVNTTLPLILNIIGALFCVSSCLGTIVCIVGIVFSVQAMNASKTGDIVLAQSKAKLALTLGIVGLVVGLLGNIGIAIFRFSQ